MFDLSNRVAVVTGASAGLGVEFAEALAKQGADIAIIARRMEKLESIAEKIHEKYGVKVLPIAADVTDTEQVNQACEKVVDFFGTVDILVNNAGGSKAANIEETSDEVWEYAINLIMNSTFKCTRAFGNEMLKQGYGRVINIASILGLGGIEGMPVSSYSAGKGGVLNFTRAAAAEWATKGVTVNAICPGFFASESNSPEALEQMNDLIIPKTPMGRIGKKGELDSAVVFLAADESSYVTGATITVDGGWTAV